MSYEITVLRALLRLSRRRSSPSLAMLATRAKTDEATVRRALFALAKSGLIQRTPAGLRLTLGGLAVAVAAATVKPRVVQVEPRKAAPRMAKRRQAA